MRVWEWVQQELRKGQGWVREEDGGGSPRVSCAESPTTEHRSSRWRRGWCWIRRDQAKTARTWSDQRVGLALGRVCLDLRWPGLPGMPARSL